jgi:hypothetical protein
MTCNLYYEVINFKDSDLCKGGQVPSGPQSKSPQIQSRIEFEGFSIL